MPNPTCNACREPVRFSDDITTDGPRIYHARCITVASGEQQAATRDSLTEALEGLEQRFENFRHYINVEVNYIRNDHGSRIDELQERLDNLQEHLQQHNAEMAQNPRQRVVRDIDGLRDAYMYGELTPLDEFMRDWTPPDSNDGPAYWQTPDDVNTNDNSQTEAND